MSTFFPFTAIVGKEQMKNALVLNAIYPQIGGLLIRGERGTAKTTCVRALSALLPPIQTNAGCRFNCDPETPAKWCTECIQREKDGEKLTIITKPTPFINLPISATEDRVIGTLDVEKAIQKGIRVFDPGVLALANRGILYIDEVNLLDDHVVDSLLDAAAMGTNIVEREGISFSHPAQFILIGTMNPDEGDLRPQLTDRFGLCVQVSKLLDTHQRVQIIKRSLAYENAPDGFSQEWHEKENDLRWRIQSARRRISHISLKTADMELVAKITSELKVDGHRGDLFMLKTARAIAAFNQHNEILPNDLAMAAEFVLPHRLRTHRFGYFSETTPDENKLDVHDRVQKIVFPYIPKKEQVLPKGLYSQDELYKMIREGTDPLKDFLDTGFR